MDSAKIAISTPSRPQVVPKSSKSRQKSGLALQVVTKSSKNRDQHSKSSPRGREPSQVVISYLEIDHWSISKEEMISSSDKSRPKSPPALEVVKKSSKNRDQR